MLISKYLAVLTISSVFCLRNNTISSHHGRCLALDEVEDEHIVNLDDIETIQGHSSELDNESNDQLNEEWGEWQLTFEEEFQNFLLSLENNASDMLQEEKNEWDYWIEKMQNKWSRFHGIMSESYKSYIYNKSATWTEADWKTWIHTDWKDYMEIDWHRWINDVEYDLDKLIDERWEQWKTHQIMTWLMSNWTDEEQQYTDKLEFGKYSNKKEMEHFVKRWNKIIQWKTEKWESWIQDKEGFITNIKNEKWLQWKDDHYFLFNNWRNDFIEDWISKKRWLLWSAGRRN
ncbi:tryptophan-rich antigen (Pv-fam-a) [Plasmodium vivax Mauritania I]|uniref:Tryptophan-rich antigen (Pv-fam-a) n=1 Tax=Plasmodium vivax Mauritania I TaxID=1035515 RepID=A0A0J9T4Y1_PLAVI|nr:tryptophan-rich antigen (Pv-fam-a) [Plasmodium vivax Mauritania I]